MNPRVIVINGPTGVGKTTVMSLLASRVPGSVSITGDALRRFAPTDPAVTRAVLGEGSTYRIGGQLAALYLRAGATTSSSITCSTRPFRSNGSRRNSHLRPPTIW